MSKKSTKKEQVVYLTQKQVDKLSKYKARNGGDKHCNLRYQKVNGHPVRFCSGKPDHYRVRVSGVTTADLGKIMGHAPKKVRHNDRTHRCFAPPAAGVKRKREGSSPHRTYLNNMDEECDLCLVDMHERRAQPLIDPHGHPALRNPLGEEAVVSATGPNAITNFYNRVPAKYIYAIAAHDPNTLYHSDRDNMDSIDDTYVYTCSDLREKFEDQSDGDPTDDGEVQAMPFHHPCLVGSQRVLAAGELFVDHNSDEVQVTHRSGHYRPDRQSTHHAHRILRAVGVTTYEH